jgi:tripartite-type tricarboxylate transporter receptor subunit TctC
MFNVGNIMMNPQIIFGIFLVGIMFLGTGVVCGQPYPNKPIRIVTSAPGGGNDLAGRIIAQGLTDSLGQQVILDGRASGVVPGQIVSKAAPDGYTLLYFANSVYLVPLMISNPPYDPLKDFLCVTLAIISPNVLVVNPSSPIKSVKELIAFAKARPGELNYASASTGTSNHLAAELFKSMAGINIVRVPYKGAGPALNAVVANEVPMMFPTAGAVIPIERTGRIRALAVTTAQPTPLMPGLPTVAASGLPGFESAAITGVFVPAKTPAAIITRLNQEIVRVLKQPDVKEKLFNTGVDVVGSTPEQFTAAVKSEIAKMGKVIKEAGIRAE